MRNDGYLRSQPSVEDREKGRRRTFPSQYQIPEAVEKGEASPAGMQPRTEIRLSAERPVAE